MDYGSMAVGTLLRRHPWAEEVLEWHDVDLDTVDQTLSLSALCWLKNLDLQHVERDLEAARRSDDAWTPSWDTVGANDVWAAPWQRTATWWDDRQVG